MASHRIGARLCGLSPEQLVAFIDEQAPLWSAAAPNRGFHTTYWLPLPTRA